MATVDSVLCHVDVEKKGCVSVCACVHKYLFTRSKAITYVRPSPRSPHGKSDVQVDCKGGNSGGDRK